MLRLYNEGLTHDLSKTIARTEDTLRLAVEKTNTKIQKKHRIDNPTFTAHCTRTEIISSCDEMN
jgi:hypothetical protein